MREALVASKAIKEDKVQICLYPIHAEHGGGARGAAATLGFELPYGGLERTDCPFRGGRWPVITRATLKNTQMGGLRGICRSLLDTPASGSPGG
jgi:hypothetical protein